jgi:hypothetical protein
MAVPKLITSKGMDVKKGWFDMSSLDYSAKLSPSVTTEVPAGRVVHVDSSGNFTPGAHNTNVAIFLIQGSEDADVTNPGGAVSDPSVFLHVPIRPSGNMSGLVATGGYEIATTEFDKARTYTPGDLLTAGNDGVLTNNGVVQYVNPVVGVVSSGKVDRNHNNIPALSFWCCWLPGAAE